MVAPVDVARDIEAVRALVDPVQHRLIPAHVTLCRDDELLDLAGLRHRLMSHAFEPLVLSFGPAVAFSSHGLLLPCIAGEDGFHRLRSHLLGARCAQDHRPHITLAHPRNPKVDCNRLAHALRLTERIEIVFSSVSFIEQEDAATPWQIVETHESRV